MYRRGGFDLIARERVERNQVVLFVVPDHVSQGSVVRQFADSQLAADVDGVEVHRCIYVVPQPPTVSTAASGIVCVSNVGRWAGSSV